MPRKKNVPTKTEKTDFTKNWNYRPKAEETGTIFDVPVENETENSDFTKNWNYRPQPETTPEPTPEPVPEPTPEPTPEQTPEDPETVEAI